VVVIESALLEKRERRPMKSIGEMMMERRYIPPKDILEHPELYERAVFWSGKNGDKFQIVYKKRAD
jgi:hypothetical protein